MKQPKYQKEFEASVWNLITPKIEISVLTNKMALEDNKIKRIEIAIRILETLKAIL